MKIRKFRCGTFIIARDKDKVYLFRVLKYITSKTAMSQVPDAILPYLLRNGFLEAIECHELHVQTRELIYSTPYDPEMR